MLILGINNGIDAGSALVSDGTVLACVNEERLNRTKLFWGPPMLSMQAVFDIAGVDPSEVDWVAQSSITGGGGPQLDFSNPPAMKQLVEIGSVLPFAKSNLLKHGYRWLSGRGRSDPIVDARLREIGCNAEKTFIEHHHCHAATAYYCSPFGEFPEDVLVMTADGVGDGICHSANTVSANHQIERRNESMIYHSIAELYGWITHNLGFRYNRHEGKITGLAAYGDPTKTLPIFRDQMGIDATKLELRLRLRGWGRPGAKKLARLFQGFSREDVAAGVQKGIEEVMSALVSATMRRYGKRYLCVAGGLFCNVRMNQILAELPEVDDVYVHPGMGDAGQGLGAALGRWAEIEPFPKPRFLPNVYLGADYTDEEIEQALRANQVTYHRSENVHEEIAELLARKRVVARFQGRMEYGPRALGHRSILFHTEDPEVNVWLNEWLKRTEFMPFAPIILKERAGDYFEDFDQKRSVAAQFMTITYRATELGRRKAAAAVHVDGTARPQVVTLEENPDSYGILKAYERRTGSPVLINTSFNMHEEPIVCTPDDGTRAFLQGNLHVLAIGDYIAHHPDVSQD